MDRQMNIALRKTLGLPMVPISGRSKVSMKKFAKVIEMIGTVVFSVLHLH